ncbi:MAG: ATP-binding protein [Planctomycetes bacterium]|nr:ATP-binding protein [Planctomycetota bacterium]
MIERSLASHVARLRCGYPAVSITGPRQSGKTTFARETFSDLPCVNLESPLERAEVADDPLGFLARFPEGAILDEVQNVPDLLSFLQVRIDEDQKMGRWILTGSRQMELTRGVTQSLAGRVALLDLLPFSLAELADAPRRPSTLPDAVLRGGYPALYDPSRDLEPARWLENYLATLVNRDIRQILEVQNRTAFDRFLGLCAARTAQMFKMSELARDCAVDNKTIQAWLRVLEECYVVRLLRAHHRNFGKRLVKSPKLYFIDSGLACRLLHISDVNQLRVHPLWGALVETWCFGEILKSRVHRGVRPDMWFWRSSDGIEVDIVIETGGGVLLPIEIRASATPFPADAAGIRKLRELSSREPGAAIAPGLVVYAGAEQRPAGEDRFVPWNAIAEALAGRAG